MQTGSLDQEDPLEKEIATHSSILAWEIPWTEESGRVQSMGSQSVRHNGAHIHAGFQLYLKSREKKVHVLLEILPDLSSPMGMPHCHQLVAPINLLLIY